MTVCLRERDDNKKEYGCILHIFYMYSFLAPFFITFTAMLENQNLQPVHPIDCDIRC